MQGIRVNQTGIGRVAHFAMGQTLRTQIDHKDVGAHDKRHFQVRFSGRICTDRGDMCFATPPLRLKNAPV